MKIKRSAKHLNTDGYLEIVRLLLADSRVDPAASDNEAIREASTFGRIQLLLAQVQKGAAAFDFAAVKMASKYSYQPVLSLLLEHLLREYIQENVTFEVKSNRDFPRRLYEIAYDETEENDRPLLSQLMQSVL